MLAALIAPRASIGDELADASCRILPFAGVKPGPGEDGPYYWYDAIEVRGGAECVVAIGADGPRFVFHFVPEADGWNQFERVDVTANDGRLLQRLSARPQRPSWFEAPPASVPYLRIEDINFDGHPDVGVFVRFTIPGNALYEYWLFDPATQMFVAPRAPYVAAWAHSLAEMGNPEISNPRLDVTEESIIATSHEGGGGRLYTETAYRIRDRQLQPFREERQQWIDGHYVRTIHEASETGTAVETRSPGPDRRAPYDDLEWHVLASASGNVGHGSRSQVLLLASREVTDLSGFDQPRHDANLVIIDGKNVVYRLRDDPPRPAGDVHHDVHPCTEPSDLELRDVTGDGAAEVMFRCGTLGVSDGNRSLHIVHYDRDSHAFRDVAHEEFMNSGLSSFEWRSVDGISIAITGHGEWQEDEGHYGPHFYEYAAYCWNAAQRDFVRVYSARSETRLDEDAWHGDLAKRMPAVDVAARENCR